MPRRTTLLLIALAATYFTVLETLGMGLSDAMRSVETHWPETALRSAIVWFSSLLVLPWCVFMARVLPVRGANWRLRLPLHLLGALVFCAMHIVADVLLTSLVGLGKGGDQLRSTVGLFGYYAAVESLYYFVIVGALLLARGEREARERELAAERIKAALSDARLGALRAQLAPHFLFNTLNGIAVLALRGDGARVAQAIGQLGELLRAALDSATTQRIPLERELEFLDRYLALQSLRFSDRLQIERSIDAAALRALVPSFVLQPLVENAVRHGLAGMEGGTVSVSALRDGAWLDLAISDSGPGFGPSPPRAGVGLANTGARMAALYGDDAHIAFDDLPTGGARVRLRLPFEATDDEGKPTCSES
jgi:hypothetical protein